MCYKWAKFRFPNQQNSIIAIIYLEKRKAQQERNCMENGSKKWYFGPRLNIGVFSSISLKHTHTKYYYAHRLWNRSCPFFSLFEQTKQTKQKNMRIKQLLSVPKKKKK